MNNFNAVRLILSLLVILSHSFEIKYSGRHEEPLSMIFGTLSFGQFAVDCFFIISGYLILKSWHRQPTASRYLVNRALRIIPGYAACHLLCLLVVAPLFFHGDYFKALDLSKALTNLALLGQPQTPPVFTSTLYPGVNVSLWTIQYEFACYLLVAVYGILGLLTSKRAWVLTTLAFMLAFSLGTLGMAPSILEPVHTWLGKAVIRLPMFFLCGGLFVLFPAILQQRMSWAVSTLLALGLSVAMSQPQWAELGLATIGGYLLLKISTAKRSWTSHLVDKLDVSYGVYLYAWPVSQGLYVAFPAQSATSNFLVSSVGALGLGYLSWKFVEAPCLKYKA
jgi:peptidoglycan/LPS O-acetylase OafA/YrhL